MAMLSLSKLWDEDLDPIQTYPKNIISLLTCTLYTLIRKSSDSLYLSLFQKLGAFSGNNIEICIFSEVKFCLPLKHTKTCEFLNQGDLLGYVTKQEDRCKDSCIFGRIHGYQLYTKKQIHNRVMDLSEPASLDLLSKNSIDPQRGFI